MSPQSPLCREGAVAVGHSTACKKGPGSKLENKAAFSQRPRLLLQMETVDKFAISLVPSSRATFASLVTLQQFLIF